MDDLEINRDLYYSGLEHSNKISDRNFNLLTSLSILGTGEIIIIQDVFPFQFSIWEGAYILVCTISVILFIKAVIQFIGGYHGYAYSYIDIIAINKECSIVRENLKNQNVSPEQISQKVASIYIMLLSESYLSCALQNQKTNVEKNHKNNKMTRSVIHSFISLMVNFVVYLIFHNMKEGNLYV